MRFGDLAVRVAGGPDRQGGGDGPVVVLCHGFGAPAEDLVPLWRVLDVPDSVRFVFPAALMPMPGAMGGRAWWMVDMEAMQRAMMGGPVRDLMNERPPGLDEARDALSTVLDHVTDTLGVPGERIVLGGFSQGAMLSMDLALRSDRPLAGLALLSGTYLCAPEWTPLMPARRGLPVLQSHGRADPILPFDAAEKLRDAMQDAGLDVRWVPHGGGHEIPGTALDGLGQLIRDCLRL